jgi:hypothetical protein
MPRTSKADASQIEAVEGILDGRPETGTSRALRPTWPTWIPHLSFRDFLMIAASVHTGDTWSRG